MGKAICYLRVSTQEQAKEGVISEAQEIRLGFYCKSAQLEIIETIRDEGISGAEPFASRLGGRKLLQLLSQKKAEHIVALKLDRLFRDAEDALYWTQAWEKTGITLHLVDVGGQSISTATTLGKFFLSIILSFAELERNLRAEKKGPSQGVIHPFFEISTPRHMLEKAKREFEKMRLDLNTDNIFNFFVTAYHIMDYVKAQVTADQEAIGKMCNDPDFKMCNFICNKGKHLKLAKEEANLTVYFRGATYKGFRYKAHRYKEGPSYYLLAGSQRINLLELGGRLLQKWEEFLSESSVQSP